MLTESSPLLPTNIVNNETQTTHAEKAKNFFKDLFYYLSKTAILGGSLQTGLDIYLKTWQFDIQKASNKDFNSHTISVIGSYLALTGALLGYITYRRLHNADINNKVNYIIYKITQAIAAWGLHAYLLKLFLFIVTESCKQAYQAGNAHPCPNHSDEQLPLDIFCCIDSQHTTNPNNPAINLNEIAFIALAASAMEITWYAMDVFRYELTKQSPSKKIILNGISWVAASVSYLITKLVAPAKLPLLYYSLIPISIYQLTHLLTSLPMIIVPNRKRDNNSDLVIINDQNNYKNGFIAACLNGFAGAALLQSLGYTYELSFLPHATARNLVQYMASTGIGFAVAYQAKTSHSPSDFLNRILSYLLPKPLLSRLPYLSNENRRQSSRMTSDNTYHQLVRTDRFWGHRQKKLAGILLSGALSFVIADSAIHYAIQTIPSEDYTRINDSWQARWVRFSLAIAGFCIYGGTSYAEPVNITNDLKVTWPSFKDFATFMVMSIGIYEKIKNENSANFIVYMVLSGLLLASCLFGKYISYKNVQHNIAEPEKLETSDSASVIQKFRRNISGWSNHWCSCFSPPKTDKKISANKSITTVSEQPSIPKLQ